MTRRIVAALILSVFPLLSCTEDSRRLSVIRDIEYARVREHALKLDLHQPIERPRSPVIVWIHGSAWRSGSNSGMPLGKLIDEGYASASVDYRLSTEAKFPAQIHEIKAAPRFLRGHGGDWRVPSKKILIAGDSAGAHLAAPNICAPACGFVLVCALPEERNQTSACRAA